MRDGLTEIWLLALLLAVAFNYAETGLPSEACVTPEGEREGCGFEKGGAYSLLQASRGGHRKVNLHDDVARSTHVVPDKRLNSSGTAKLDPPGNLPGFTGDVVITVAAIACGQSVFAPSGRCPSECPFFAEEAGRPCFFQCVPASECGSLIAENRIADTRTMNCRPCKIAGCETCAFGPIDACAECASGYNLNSLDGTCRSTYLTVWRSIFTLFGVVVFLILVWYIQLLCTPSSNPEGVQEGLAYRSSRKLLIPKGDEMQAGLPESEVRQLWPLSSNLHILNIAGPGLNLHWNFKLASIIWACLILISWTVFAYSTHPEQLLVGLMTAQTPSELCSVTMTGRAMQHAMMRSKALYVLIAYLGTFIGCVIYSVIQQQVFERMEDETSMDDYAALLVGLPKLNGSDRCEEKLQQYLQDTLGHKVVGVSICWDYRDSRTVVLDTLEVEREESHEHLKARDERTLVRKAFGQVDKLLGFEYNVPTPKVAKREEEMTDMLKAMVSTDSAFVVFDSEAARNAAVAWVRDRDGIMFEGRRLTLQREVCEPNTVQWDSFHVSSAVFTFRILLGVVCILLALVVWVLVFYLPYAYYASTFSYSHGEEPGILEGFVFSMGVVIGNVMMYQICNRLAYAVGFRFRDRSEGFYILLYFTACTLNIMADMSVEYLAGYRALVAAKVHTADGRLLETLTDSQEIFESYPMQKVLGSRLFAYCFPATFLVPFLVEPIFSIFLPFHVSKLLVRTHPEVRGPEAEKAMDFFTPYDLSRYGDVLLNLMLVSFIFFFPSGSILKLFLAFIACHIYIYVYDQYRVLRAVPAFCYSSDVVDRYAQAIMAIPCATLASCFVFKANCVDGSYCIRGLSLLWACALAFVCHLLVHYACIFLLVPNLRTFHHDHVQTEVPYAEAARRFACTWFSANPVHCLRSKYIYRHSPPCSFWTHGKEHLMEKNPKIGVYFEDTSRPVSEEYDAHSLLAATTHSLSWSRAAERHQTR